MKRPNKVELTKVYCPHVFGAFRCGDCEIDIWNAAIEAAANVCASVIGDISEIEDRILGRHRNLIAAGLRKKISALKREVKK